MNNLEKGKIGESLVEEELKRLIQFFPNAKYLRNIYVPKMNRTNEIDLLLITTKGIFVIENKHISGSVFGKESDQTWTIQYSKTKKEFLKNPIQQNRSHIAYLKQYLNHSLIQIFSLIVFTNGKICKMQVESADVKVIEFNQLSPFVMDYMNCMPNVLDDAEILEIYEKLYPLTNVMEEVKLKHIQDIQSRSVSNERILEEPKILNCIYDENNLEEFWYQSTGKRKKPFTHTVGFKILLIIFTIVLIGIGLILCYRLYQKLTDKNFWTEMFLSEEDILHEDVRKCLDYDYIGISCDKNEDDLYIALTLNSLPFQISEDTEQFNAVCESIFEEYEEIDEIEFSAKRENTQVFYFSVSRENYDSSDFWNTCEDVWVSAEANDLQ